MGAGRREPLRCRARGEGRHWLCSSGFPVPSRLVPNPGRAKDGSAHVTSPGGALHSPGVVEKASPPCPGASDAAGGGGGKSAFSKLAGDAPAAWARTSGLSGGGVCAEGLKSARAPERTCRFPWASSHFSASEMIDFRHLRSWGTQLCPAARHWPGVTATRVSGPGAVLTSVQ